MDGRLSAPGVWVTRSQPGAARTAARLTALGYMPLVAPLIETRPLPVEAPEPAEVDALAFTSAVAVALAAVWGADFREKPVFTVGDATAEEAGRLGFAHVRSAAGDGRALADLLVAACAPGLRILHPAAAKPAFDLAAAAAGSGVTVRTLPVYKTVAARQLPPSAEEALGAGRIAAVLLHSPAAARAAATLAPPRLVRGVRFVALSAACAEPVRSLATEPPTLAARPDEDALLAALAALRLPAAAADLGKRSPRG